MKRRILSVLLAFIMLLLAFPVTLFTAVATEGPIVDIDISGSNLKWGGAFRASGTFDMSKSTTTEGEKSFTSFKVTKRGYNRGVGATMIVTDGVNNLKDKNYLLVQYRIRLVERGVSDSGETLAYPSSSTKWYLLVILEDGSTYGYDAATIVSSSGMNTSGEWATMKFDLSGITDDAVVKELWIYPYMANQPNITDSAYPARPRGQTAKEGATGSQPVRIAYEKGDIIDIMSVSYLVTCWVNLDFDGTNVGSTEINYGDSYILPEGPTKRGYDFVGWSDGTNVYRAGESAVISDNVTFTAVFEQKPIHTVTAVSDGKTLSSTSVIDGETYTLPVTQRKDGYNFVGWTDGVNTYAAREVVTVNSDITFTAVFTPKATYNVTVVSDGQTVDTASVTDGLTYTLPAAQEKYGYTFKGWSDGETTYAAGTKITIKKATTFTAVFEALPVYSVTVTNEGVTVENTTRITGETYTLPAAPVKAGYNFLGWSDGTTTHAAGTTLTITKTVVFTAVFEEKAKYTATVVSDGVTVATGSVYKGDFFTLPAAPVKDGYVFTAWSDGADKFAAGESVRLVADTTFTALFTQATLSRESYQKYVNPFTFDGTSLSGGSGDHLRMSTVNATMLSSFTDANGKTGTTLNATTTRYTAQFIIGKSYFPTNVNISFEVYFNDLPTYEEGAIGIFTDRSKHKTYLEYTLDSSWLRVWTDANGKSWASMLNCDKPFEITTGKWYSFKFFGSGTSSNKKNEYIYGWAKELGDDRYTEIGTLMNCSYTGATNQNLFAFYNNPYASYTLSNFMMSTKEDEHFIKLDGVQYSAVADGKYNVRFVAALGGLVDGQTAVGFEVVCGEQGKRWEMETVKVYNSILASYGLERITAESIGGEYISTFTIENIPVSAGKIALVCTPYVIVNGQRYYGSSVTVVHDPAAQN